MDEYKKQIIKDMADKYRAELVNGRLYGEPIDMNDADMVLVAAVCKAVHEESLKGARSLDVAFSLMGIRS